MEQYIAHSMFLFCGMGAKKAIATWKSRFRKAGGTGTAHTIPGDDNLFGSQIQPVDDKWWKAFGDPMLDSLIATASAGNFSVLSAIDRMDMAKANWRIERGEFLPFRFPEWRMGTPTKQRQCK